MTGTDASPRRDPPPPPGTSVLEWLRSPEATARARSAVRRHGLPGGSATVDDVLGDATVAVLHWQRGPHAHDPENPAAYGTRVIVNVVRRMLQGRTRAVDAPLSLDVLGLDPAVPPPEPVDDAVGDDLRVEVDGSGGPAWLVSSALSVVTFAMHPGSEPVDAPVPRAGSRPDQARVWPALDLAGQADLFPGPDGDPPARRRMRSRRITAVLGRLERAAARLAGAGGGTHRG